MRKELVFMVFFRLDKVRGLYAYVSPMCNGEVRTYVVLPKERGKFVFVVFRFLGVHCHLCSTWETARLTRP